MIMGWIKPSSHHTDSDKVSVELKRIHVVAVEPINALTDERVTGKDAMVTTAAETRAANIVAGHATNVPHPYTSSTGKIVYNR